jgi:hypothetical protein
MATLADGRRDGRPRRPCDRPRHRRRRRGWERRRRMPPGPVEIPADRPT